MITSIQFLTNHPLAITGYTTNVFDLGLSESISNEIESVFKALNKFEVQMDGLHQVRNLLKDGVCKS